jgi:hypothetical protein
MIPFFLSTYTHSTLRKMFATLCSLEDQLHIVAERTRTAAATLATTTESRSKNEP